MKATSFIFNFPYKRSAFNKSYALVLNIINEQISQQTRFYKLFCASIS